MYDEYDGNGEEKQNHFMKESEETKKIYEDIDQRFGNANDNKVIFEKKIEEMKLESEEKPEEAQGEETEYIDTFLGPLYEEKPAITHSGSTWFKKLVSAFLAFIVITFGIFLIFQLWEDKWDSFIHASDSERSVQDQNQGNEEENAQDSVEGQEEIIPAAKEDKSELLQKVAASYPEIKEIRYNSELRYDPGKTYSIPDLASSIPLTENFWYEENGENILYDESLVRCILQFNVSWIDYVNTGDLSVFQLLNREGQATTDASGFNNKNLYESFDLLEIGEIRQGDGKFYVFTYEEIQATRGNVKNTRKYYWIYTIVVHEKQLLINGYALA